MRRAALFIGCGLLGYGCGSKNFGFSPPAMGAAGTGTSGAPGHDGEPVSGAGGSSAGAKPVELAGEGGEAGEPERGGAGGMPSSAGMGSGGASSGSSAGGGDAGASAGAAGEFATGGRGGVAGTGGRAGAAQGGSGGTSGGAGKPSAGGGSGTAGGAGSGVGGASSYCDRLPAPLAVDCSGECAPPNGNDQAACDAAWCTYSPVKSYIFGTASVPDVDEVILPNRVTGTNDTRCTNVCAGSSGSYWIGVEIRNNTGAPIFAKVSSPSMNCGSPGCWTMQLAGTGVDTGPAIELPAPVDPAAAWIRVEIHTAEWAEYSTCDPEPL